jgi:hypothetical protein
VDVSYQGPLRKDASPEALVKALNRLEGVQGRGTSRDRPDGNYRSLDN